MLLRTSFADVTKPVFRQWWDKVGEGGDRPKKWGPVGRGGKTARIQALLNRNKPRDDHRDHRGVIFRYEM